MKKIFLLFLFLSFTVFVNAQTQPPNAGFETWTNNIPDGYTAPFDAFFGTNTFEMSSDKHSGNYAMKVKTSLLNSGGTTTSLLGIALATFPYTDKPLSVSGWYKTNLLANDSGIVFIGFNKWNITGDSADAVGGNSLVLNHSANWTQFNIPFQYLSSDIPDTANVGFFVSSNDTFATHDVIFDDIQFSNSTGSNNHITKNNSFVMYPNPSLNSVHFLFNDINLATLQITDVTGRVVHTESVKANEVLKLDDISNGVYNVRLISNDEIIQNEKLIILK